MFLTYNNRLSKYGYTYDALGRRSDRTQSGSAFTQTNTDTFAYNARSEVTGSSSDVFTADAHNPTYNYDPIGNRFYDPGLGRWFNRDPMGEPGGLNLYAMVGNDPVGKWDYLGMVTYGQAIEHWLFGKGATFYILFNEADPGMVPSDFSDFSDKVASVCSNKSDDDVDMDQTFDNGSGHPIGRHNYTLSGDITYTAKDCSWSFTGKIKSTSETDRFDFDPSYFDGNPNNNRKLFPELSTWAGGIIGLLSQAQDFNFDITGYRSATDSGTCSSK